MVENSVTKANKPAASTSGAREPTRRAAAHIENADGNQKQGQRIRKESDQSEQRTPITPEIPGCGEKQISPVRIPPAINRIPLPRMHCARWNLFVLSGFRPLFFSLIALEAKIRFNPFFWFIIVLVHNRVALGQNCAFSPNLFPYYTTSCVTRNASHPRAGYCGYGMRVCAA